MTQPSHIDLYCFPVQQPIGTYFVGRALVSDLLKICLFDYRRMHFVGGYQELLGMQRQVSEKRQKEIAKYAGTIDAVFPTAVVLSVPEQCVQLDYLCDGLVIRARVSAYIHPDNPELNIPLEEVASIIDGQHRLKGIELSAEDMETPVALFVGADDATEASIFSVVNLAQTKVNRSLVYDLFALARHRSPEKTCHEVVVALDTMASSPFQDRIMRLGVQTEGRKGEFISQATMVRGLLPYVTSDALTDRDRGKRFGFWDPLVGAESKRRIFYHFFQQDEDEKILGNVVNYFNAVVARWPEAWPPRDESGRFAELSDEELAAEEGKMIYRTNGFNALIRFLRDAYNSLAPQPRVVSVEEYGLVLAEVKLDSADFNTKRFVPGSSGASSLYAKLRDDSAAWRNAR